MKSISQDLYRLQVLDIQALPRGKSETKNLRASIPAVMLNAYDRARARGRKGIAILRNGVCTNCRMQSPVAVAIGLASGGVQVCGNCGLYLCVDPDHLSTRQPEEVKPAKQRRSRNTTAAKVSP